MFFILGIKHIVIKYVGNCFVYIIYYELTRVTQFQSSNIRYHHKCLKCGKIIHLLNGCFLEEKKKKLVKSWQSGEASCVAECTLQYYLRFDSPLQKKVRVHVRVRKLDYVYLNLLFRSDDCNGLWAFSV